jgi:hypothetical protein
MPQGLSYTDAVRLLGGSGPLGKAVDNLLGGALSLATAGGSDLALSLFDAKAEMVRLGEQVTVKINDVVRGLGRHDRSTRLQAAHAVLVVTAFFEALDECLEAAAVDEPGFTRDEQLLLLTGAPAGGSLVSRLVTSPIPAAAADRPYAQMLADLERWYATASPALAGHLTGLAVWDRADERARRQLTELLTGWLPQRAVEHYEEVHRRLAEEIPEFAIWAWKLEARATAHGLDRLESALLRATSGRDPDRHRAQLARIYRADLLRPVLGGDAGDVVLPTLGDIYLDPRFRVKAAGPGARPADDQWWDTEIRTDLSTFLAVHLTGTRATEAPLLLLGQPGAGKSSLTRVLAGRLPASDFFVCRVALRDVPADAEIQDQVELALRAAIGESAVWADLAGNPDGALPVVLLDGFDELLQATGLHQSDYLHRVAAFQQREAALGRPVAVLVTSRVAVADRARLPVGGLAVRLEPFDDEQIERWLAVWNETNDFRTPLSAAVLRRFWHLAEQPLLLLMLALYDATGNALSEDAAFGTGQLYERLLGEFAAREVRRVHAGQPDAAMPGLVEAELVRLSVVAFAMFHRMRLWTTEQELDADLAGLGLPPSRTAQTEGFRMQITAGQEMVGRFFFIQRAQAVREGEILRTYEFLHATFGEYLVARLVVQAVRDTAAREAAGMLALRPAAQADDLLQSLLGFTPLTARATILPFVSELLDRPDRATMRAWLVRRAGQAVARPQYTPRRYQPIDKRIDHWMATYSFNLVMITLAAGGEVRASDLFTEASDPADWLRGTALQWRAAIPGGIWLESLEDVRVRRDWHEGRRDIVLTATGNAPVASVDAGWSNRLPPDAADLPSAHRGNFALFAALKSMHLSNQLSDDALLHALEPLLGQLRLAVQTFVRHGPDDIESVAHSLIQLWITSGLGDSADELAAAYDRAVTAVAGHDWTLSGASVQTAGQAIDLVLRSLVADADRLPPGRPAALVQSIVGSPHFVESAHATPAVRCLLASMATADYAHRVVLAVVVDAYRAHIDDRVLVAALHAVFQRDDAPSGMLIARIHYDWPEQAAALEHADPSLAALLSRARTHLVGGR